MSENIRGNESKSKSNSRKRMAPIYSPQPVSPETTTTLLFKMVFTICSLRSYKKKCELEQDRERKRRGDE